MKTSDKIGLNFDNPADYFQSIDKMTENERSYEYRISEKYIGICLRLKLQRKVF